MSFERFLSAYEAASIPTRSSVLMKVRARVQSEGGDLAGLWKTGNGSMVRAESSPRVWMPALAARYPADDARLAVLMDAARDAGMLS